jgi:hypothetical protein
MEWMPVAVAVEQSRIDGQLVAAAITGLPAPMFIREQ